MGRPAFPNEPGENPNHAQRARMHFLMLVGNPGNDPAKGWTCDLEWDLKLRLGMNPTNTSAVELFNYIGQHRLGYRIAMSCMQMSQTAGYWGCALDNGILPFAPHYNNNANYRFDDPIGIRAAVSVAGGVVNNGSTYGQSLEFFDAVPEWTPHPTFEDTAQSWANQNLAAKCARLLDAHPNYNIWDAREHLRQAASFWPTGWTETNGYGRVNERVPVGKPLPGPPVEFTATRSRDRHGVIFTWRNFLQSDFAATVIAGPGGRIIYDGTGTNFTWQSDVRGDASFTYWSRNRQGDKSRMESYQKRTVSGLSCGSFQTCLVLSERAGEEGLSWSLCNRFQQLATNWVCDIVTRSGPIGGAIVALRPDFPAMVDYAVSNHYRIVVAPVVYPNRDLYAYKSAWDRATAAGVLVVLPHHSSISTSRMPNARRISTPRLFSAITVGEGITTNRLSFGPGLEVYDSPPAPPGAGMGYATQIDAAAVVATKLAQILDAHPKYNIWDARQHLRQSASNYATGWIEDGGYGRPAARPAPIAALDPAPPLDIQAVKSADSTSVIFSWQNFLQSSFASTVITRQDGRTIYQGAGTNFVWRSDVDGVETFRFYSQDKTGRRSRSEAYTVLPVTALRAAQPLQR